MSEHAQTSVPMWFTVAFVAISIFFSFFKGSDKSSELALAAAGVGAGAANALEADVSKVVEDANRLAADSTETISGLANVAESSLTGLGNDESSGNEKSETKEVAAVDDDAKNRTSEASTDSDSVTDTTEMKAEDVSTADVATSDVSKSDVSTDAMTGDTGSDSDAADVETDGQLTDASPDQSEGMKEIASGGTEEIGSSETSGSSSSLQSDSGNADAAAAPEASGIDSSGDLSGEAEVMNAGDSANSGVASTDTADSRNGNNPMMSDSADKAVDGAEVGKSNLDSVGDEPAVEMAKESPSSPEASGTSGAIESVASDVSTDTAGDAEVDKAGSVAEASKGEMLNEVGASSVSETSGMTEGVEPASSDASASDAPSGEVTESVAKAAMNESSEVIENVSKDAVETGGSGSTDAVGQAEPGMSGAGEAAASEAGSNETDSANVSETEAKASETSPPMTTEGTEKVSGENGSADGNSMGATTPADSATESGSIEETARAEAAKSGVASGDAMPAATQRPWLGVRMEIPNPQVVVVYPTSGAEDAKVMVGDVIVGINDVETPTTESVITVLKKHKANDTIDLKVMRGDQKLILPLFLGKTRPVPTTGSSEAPKAAAPKLE